MKFFDIDDEAILSPDEIAKILGMHPESIRRWCRIGKMDCYTFGGKYIILGSDFKKFMKFSKI